MKIALAFLPISLLSLLFGSAAPSRAASPPARLLAAARAGGRVRVIARLAVPAGPAGAPIGPGRRRREVAAATHRLLARRTGAGWRPVRTFETVPFVAIEADAAGLQALARAPEVEEIFEDRLERVSLRETIPLVGADRAAEDGFDGSGRAVAIIDTGVDASHPFLRGRVVSEACFSSKGDCPDGSSTQLGAGAAAPCDYAPLACAHGTHVAGIAAGSAADRSGVAPGAEILAIQVFSRFDGAVCAGDVEDPCAASFVSDQTAALERVLELSATLPIAAVNISIGGPTPFSSQEICDAIEAPRRAVVEELRSAGIATVVAAGNEGVAWGLTAPACLSNVVSVGATTDFDTIAPFSNTAPFLSLLAPGTAVVSSVPGGGFGSMSGTSMAAPHVAGALAVLAAAAPARSLADRLAALRAGGVAIEDPRSGLSFPRLSVPGALAELGVRLGGSNRGVLEQPPDGGDASGILAFAGWICDAQKVEIRIDGGAPMPAGYGTPRADTVAACGDDDNGFSLLFDFALLGDGEHEAVLLADGVEVDRSTFRVATLGVPFLRGAPPALVTVPGFAGRDVELRWSEPAQNFVIVGSTPSAR